MWLASQEVSIKRSLEISDFAFFLDERVFEGPWWFLPEDIALSTVSAASGTSATLEMKIAHLLASDRLTTSLKVKKFIRLLTVEKHLSCLINLLCQENNLGNLQWYGKD